MPQFISGEFEQLARIDVPYPCIRVHPCRLNRIVGRRAVTFVVALGCIGSREVSCVSASCHSSPVFASDRNGVETCRSDVVVPTARRDGVVWRSAARASG